MKKRWKRTKKHKSKKYLKILLLFSTYLPNTDYDEILLKQGNCTKNTHISADYFDLLDQNLLMPSESRV